MAKAALSSGGGGSHGKAMNWQDALATALRRPEVPADAITVEGFAKKHGIKAFKVRTTLLREWRAGRLNRAEVPNEGGYGTHFCYWPARK